MNANRKSKLLDYTTLAGACLLTAGVLFGAMTCAHANDMTAQDLTNVIAIVGVYDLNCAPIPSNTANSREIVQIGNNIPHNELVVAVVNMQAEMERIGKDKWCQSFKPIIDNMMTGRTQ